MAKRPIPKPKNKFMLAALSVAAIALIGGSFYLLNNVNQGSEEADAGFIKSIVLEKFKFEIEPMDITTQAQEALKTGGNIQWKYTVNGYTSDCFTASVAVNGDKEIKEEADAAVKEAVDSTDQTTLPQTKLKKETILVLRLTEKTSCGTTTNADARPDVPVSFKGSFSARNNSRIRVLVSYDSLTKQPKDTEKLSLAGITLNTKYQGNSKKGYTGKWTYTATGKTSNCYTPSIWATRIFDKESDILSERKGYHNGVYVVRLLKNNKARETCTDKAKAVNVSGGTVVARKAGIPTRLNVRYVYRGVLHNPKTENVPTVEAPAKVTKNGWTLEYYYQGESEWKYKVTGKVNSSCTVVKPSVATAKSLPERVTISLNVSQSAKKGCRKTVTRSIEVIKSGVFSASEKAQINFLGAVPGKD